VEPEFLAGVRDELLRLRSVLDLPERKVQEATPGK